MRAVSPNLMLTKVTYYTVAQFYANIYQCLRKVHFGHSWSLWQLWLTVLRMETGVHPGTGVGAGRGLGATRDRG